MQTEVTNTLTAARAWARARARCRRIADSKRASDGDLTKAKAQLSVASDALAKAIDAFEKALAKGSRRSRRPVNWGKVFEVVGSFANAVETAVRDKPPIAVGVIDTTGEPVPFRRRKQT